MPTLLAIIAAFTLQDDLSTFDARVLPEPQPRMIGRDASERIRQENRNASEAWGEIRSREAWERFRDARIKSLRASLGADEPVPKDLKIRVTKTLEGAGHTIENLVFESRPGLLVTANLYVPSPVRAKMPGILIIHSHHNPKTQGELQDMGVLWARLGCLVLVMDQLGHGERRQHPFVDASSFKGSFRPTRQDYWFRYNVGLQLQLAGESLIGWMAWDLMRGVDLLLARPGIDKERIILMGSVAGGGDPCGVTAAIDPRITAAVPFNFGGPQPESKYPLPEDAETSFNYAGGGSWESTRNLRLSARDGFLPWVIVGSLAPRRLVYAHEFSWDRERDPVWKRFEKIYGFYDAGGDLASTTGRGVLSGKPPEATHCNNIGDVHRQGIYAALQKWFEIPAPEKEPQERRPAADLLCLTPELKPRLVHDLIRDRRAPSGVKAWELGNITPEGEPKVEKAEPRKVGGTSVERVVLEVEAGIVVPLIFLVPADVKRENLPVVVAIAQGGKQEFLKKRSAEIAALLKGGIAVCLPDLRGTGETRPGDGRGRGSEATSIASTELMLGRTMLGLRMRDLRSVLRYLRGRPDVDRARIGLWGDSFAPVNAPDRVFAMPHDAEGLPDLAEPMGGIVALYTALFDEEIRAVYVRGGLVSFRSVLESPFVYIPYDVIVPGASTGADLPKIAESLGSRAVKLEGLVDGLNRRVDAEPIGSAAWLLEPLKKP